MTFKRVICGIAAAVLIMSMGCGALAEQAAGAAVPYTESVSNFPQQFHSEIPISNLFAFSGGQINYFCEYNQQSEKTNQPAWYQTIDNGKQWKTMDMSWYVAESKKYQKAGQAESFYMTENGSIYWIMYTGDATAKVGSYTKNFPAFQIFVYENQKVRQIPNIKLENPYYFQYKIVGVKSNGDIVILEQSEKEEEAYQIFKFHTYDGSTGALKKTTQPSNPKFVYRCYANNTVYGMDYLSNPSEFQLLGYNVETGAQTLAIPLPKPSSKNVTDAIAAREDGTIFIACLAGIYRLDPGQKNPVKLIDGSKCRFGQDNTRCGQTTCTADGMVYIPVRYVNHKNEANAPANNTDGKLYCYRTK